MTSESSEVGRLAVGGLLLRYERRPWYERNRKVIAVEHNFTHSGSELWSLPKGVADANDRTIEESALRVVRERVRLDVSSIGFADGLQNPSNSLEPVALYWFMKITGPPPIGQDAPHDESVRWVQVDEAAELLSGPGERGLLQRAIDQGLPRVSIRSRDGTRSPLNRRNLQLKRLNEEIDDLSTEVREASKSLVAVQRADGHVRRARRAALGRDLDTGWGQAFRAREALVCLMGEDEVYSEAVALKAEVSGSDKINRWRRDAAVLQLKAVIDADGGLVKTTDLRTKRVALARALQLRNESFSNEYRHLSILRRHQRNLLLLGTTALLLAISALFFGGPETQPASDRWTVIASLAMGVVGAVVSAAQRSTQLAPTRIPRALNSHLASLSRVAIGGVAGVLAWLTANAVDPPVSVAAMLIAAFGAGFAERLVTASPST